MQLRHMTGSVIEVDTVRCGKELLLQVGEGDAFGPVLAYMMFTSFPACIISASEEEMDYLRSGGYIIEM